MALQGRGRGSRLEALLVRKLSEAERAVQRALPLRVREGGLPHAPQPGPPSGPQSRPRRAEAPAQGSSRDPRREVGKKVQQEEGASEATQTTASASLAEAAAAVGEPQGLRAQLASPGTVSRQVSKAKAQVWSKLALQAEEKAKARPEETLQQQMAAASAAATAAMAQKVPRGVAVAHAGPATQPRQDDGGLATKPEGQHYREGQGRDAGQLALEIDADTVFGLLCGRRNSWIVDVERETGARRDARTRVRSELRFCGSKSQLEAVLSWYRQRIRPNNSLGKEALFRLDVAESKLRTPAHRPSERRDKHEQALRREDEQWREGQRDQQGAPPSQDRRYNPQDTWDVYERTPGWRSLQSSGRERNGGGQRARSPPRDDFGFGHSHPQRHDRGRSPPRCSYESPSRRCGRERSRSPSRRQYVRSPEWHRRPSRSSGGREGERSHSYRRSRSRSPPSDLGSKGRRSDRHALPPDRSDTSAAPQIAPLPAGWHGVVDANTKTFYLPPSTEQNPQPQWQTEPLGMLMQSNTVPKPDGTVFHFPQEVMLYPAGNGAVNQSAGAQYRLVYHHFHALAGQQERR